MDSFIWSSKVIHIPVNFGTATKLKIFEIEFCVGIGKLRKVERAPSSMSPSVLKLLFQKISLALASQRVTWQLYFALNKIYFSLLSSFSIFQTKEKSLEESFFFPLYFSLIQTGERKNNFPRHLFPPHLFHLSFLSASICWVEIGRKSN